MSFWSAAGPLLGVVLGGVLTSGGTIFGDERRARRERQQRNDERRESRANQRWTAELEGVTSVQVALSSMVSICVAVQIRSTSAEDSELLVAIKEMTLAISRIFDDDARSTSERAATALTNFCAAARAGSITPQLLQAAVSTADEALSQLGAVLRRLYEEGPVTNP